MKVTRLCVVTGKPYTTGDIPPEGLFLWELGLEKIQDALPTVSPEDREFLMSGTSPEGWKQLFGDPVSEEVQ